MNGNGIMSRNRAPAMAATGFKKQLTNTVSRIEQASRKHAHSQRTAARDWLFRVWECIAKPIRAAASMAYSPSGACR